MRDYSHFNCAPYYLSVMRSLMFFVDRFFDQRDMYLQNCIKHRKNEKKDNLNEFHFTLLYLRFR